MLHASAQDAGRADVRRAHKLIRSRHETHIGTFSSDDRLALRRLVAGPSNYRTPLASDLSARQASADLMINHFVEFYDCHADEHSHTYMGTFAWDLGFTPLHCPVVQLRAIRNRIDKIMRRHELHGVYFVELEILLKLPDEPGPRLMVHVHTACWHCDRPVKPRRLACEIMRVNALPNNLGARSVVFTKHARTPEGAVKLASYLVKFPACVKRRKQHPERGSFSMRHEQDKYTPQLVFRMIEILSHLSIYECVGAVGEGKKIAAPWRRDLKAWAKAREDRWLRDPRHRKQNPVTLESAQAFWSELRELGLVEGDAVIVER